MEQWIRAKYEREEFCHPERQNHYVSGFMEGFLMKRGKEDSRYHPRKFVLCEAEDTLKYHVKENKVCRHRILEVYLASQVSLIFSNFFFTKRNLKQFLEYQN